jgi:hypothetical protein
MTTTAKKGGGKKGGKRGAGRGSPPSGARVERKRKSSTRGKEDASGQGVPKISKSEVGGGNRGGRLH